MKVIFSFFILLSSVFSSSGQSTDSVVTLISERHVKLNGGARSQVGGKSRTFIKVDLPPNTTSWYYSFSTQSYSSGTNNLNLGLQLMAAIASSGRASSLTSMINVPAGTGSADIIVTDKYNIDRFITKDDNWGGTVKRYEEGSVYNTKQGVIEIDDVTSGTLYLGLKNPGTWDALDIYIEVVAIVDFSTESSWPIEVIDVMYEEIIVATENEGLEKSIAASLATCVIEHLISTYSLDEMMSLSETELAIIEEEIMNECMHDENSCEESDQAEVYGNLGWTYFESGKTEKSIKYGEMALEICDQNMAWVEANIGLSYLVQDSIDLALDWYVSAISSSKKSRFGKQYLKGALDDLEKYNDQYPIISEHPEIRSLIEIELM